MVALDGDIITGLVSIINVIYMFVFFYSNAMIPLPIDKINFRMVE